MATYQLPDGRTVSTDMAFTLNEIQYPSNWLALSSAQDRAERDIEGPLPEPAWYDQRWCWGYDEDGKLIWKDHAPLVMEYINNVRANANAMLRETDWQVIREADNGKPMGAGVKAERERIRTAAGGKITAINATTTTAELAAYIASNAYSDWNPIPEPAPIHGVEFFSNGVTTAGF
jgi:hypothetical protein